MEDQTRLFYDLTAERTADEWYENDVLMPTIQDFLSLLPERPRILDLGCGPGHESMRLASKGAVVIGVDFSSECVRVARERCPQCRFEVMDFRQLDQRFGRFDGVFACASLIHIESEELPTVFQRIATVLEDSGYLLAIVRYGEGIRESQPVVDGQELRRSVCLYTKESLASAAPQFHFAREGYLAPDLAEQGWRCYVFRKRSPNREPEKTHRAVTDSSTAH